MKLLFLISQIHQLGGAEKLSFDLAIALSKRGYNVDVGLVYQHPSGTNNIEKLESYGIGVSYLDMPVGSNKVAVFKYVLRLRKKLLSGQYDLVETGTVIPSIILSLATFFTKTRCVFGIHQVYDLKREVGINYQVYRKLISIKSSSKVYFISKFVEQAANRFFVLKKQKTFTLYNCIRPEFSDSLFLSSASKQMLSSELGFKPSHRVILYCGRFAEYKGVKIVYEASKPFLFDEERECVLIFLGAIDLTVSGTQDVLDNIKEDVERCALFTKVLFLSHREDVRDIMLLADVLVHPTRIEGFGLSLVEAMALNLPIVTSRAEAIPEILEGTTANMISEFSVEKYRAAIAEVFNMSEYEREQARLKNDSQIAKYHEDFRVTNFIKEVLS
jgi:glycosyltransferase involved in cell wall biosynthesis